MKYRTLFLVSLTLANALSGAAVLAQEPDYAAPGEVPSGRHMTEAARALLESLGPAELDAVMFPLAGEARTNWSNVPPYVHPRPGLRMGGLDADQRLRVHDLLRASLSSQGYQKVAGVMRLDDVHRERTLQGLATDASEYDRAVAESFGYPSYAVAIFGDPRTDDEWGWLLQGHHLGASFTVAKDRVGYTPLFIGAGPLQVDRGADVGWSAVSYELDYAVDLVRSLTPDQLEVALSDEPVPGDVHNSVGSKRHLTPPEGLRARDMTAAQSALLRRLVEEYVRNANTAAALSQLRAIEAAGWENLSFSWRGALGGRDEEFYYRVQGERILIECTHQPQHVHTIVRDPGNDYGERWLDFEYLEETSAQDLFAAARQRAGGQ